MIWRLLWKIFRRPLPRLRAVVVVTGNDGTWVKKQAVGLTFRGARDVYATMELLRKHNPEWESFFRMCE